MSHQMLMIIHKCQKTLRNTSLPTNREGAQFVFSSDLNDAYQVFMNKFQDSQKATEFINHLRYLKQNFNSGMK